MLGIGWTEMLVIGVVALIVIGPKELPAVMQRIGKFAGTIRRMGGDFQRELNKTTGLNEIVNLRNSVTQPLKATAEAIRKEFNTTTAAGKVEPSGALKPADPKAESVVDEIKAKAGMAPQKAAPLPLTAAAAAAAKSAEAAEKAATATPAAPVKARRAPRVKLPADTPVETAELPAAKPKVTAAKSAAAKSAATKPGAAEPTAPKPAAAKSLSPKPVAAQPAATKAATPAKPKAAKPVATAKASAAKPAPVTKSASAAPASASAEPAPKPASRPRKPATKKA
jgi:sec-independent protein translocase protein TatB